MSAHRILIRSTRDGVVVQVDGQDITDMVLADPRPQVSVAPANEIGQSTVTLTLQGELDLEVDGEVIVR